MRRNKAMQMAIVREPMKMGPRCRDCYHAKRSHVRVYVNEVYAYTSCCLEWDDDAKGYVYWRCDFR